MPHAPRIQRVRDYARMPWKNGAGWTSEIARWPAGETWDWRLSVADIDADAPFSAFNGVERTLVLLSGNGMRLRFNGGRSHELAPPHGCLRFAGEAEVAGELIEGPTRDFNLMWRRDTCDAQLWQRPLVGTVALFVDPEETWVLHLIAGSARFTSDAGLGELGAGDTAILPGQSTRQRFVLEGQGSALIIRIARRGVDAPAPAQSTEPHPCTNGVVRQQPQVEARQA